MSEYLWVGIDGLTQAEIDSLSDAINDWFAEHGTFHYIGLGQGE